MSVYKEREISRKILESLETVDSITSQRFDIKCRLTALRIYFHSSHQLTCKKFPRRNEYIIAILHLLLGKKFVAFF